MSVPKKSKRTHTSWWTSYELVARETEVPTDAEFDGREDGSEGYEWGGCGPGQPVCPMCGRYRAVGGSCACLARQMRDAWKGYDDNVLDRLIDLVEGD